MMSGVDSTLATVSSKVSFRSCWKLLSKPQTVMAGKSIRAVPAMEDEKPVSNWKHFPIYHLSLSVATISILTCQYFQHWSAESARNMEQSNTCPMVLYHMFQDLKTSGLWRKIEPLAEGRKRNWNKLSKGKQNLALLLNILHLENALS